jgi:hypothetical protein
MLEQLPEFPSGILGKFSGQNSTGKSKISYLEPNLGKRREYQVPNRIQLERR